jgi:translation initiation factor 2 beta subunit (eIF-2beta)/eIF-5
MPQIHLYSPARPKNDTPLLLLKSLGKETRNLFLRMLPIFAERCIVRFVKSFVDEQLIEPSFLKPEHVIAFLFAEMGTTGSVDGAGRLVIRGRFQQKQIENVLRRYMGNFFSKHIVYFFSSLAPLVEYVTCKTCKSPDTLLTKENRIFFMACESCGSRRSVNPIKTGFQAQVGKRTKNKTG